MMLKWSQIYFKNRLRLSSNSFTKEKRPEVGCMGKEELGCTAPKRMCFNSEDDNANNKYIHSAGTVYQTEKSIVWEMYISVHCIVSTSVGGSPRREWQYLVAAERVCADIQLQYSSSVLCRQDTLFISTSSKWPWRAIRVVTAMAQTEIWTWRSKLWYTLLARGRVVALRWIHPAVPRRAWLPGWILSEKRARRWVCNCV